MNIIRNYLKIPFTKYRELAPGDFFVYEESGPIYVKANEIIAVNLLERTTTTFSGADFVKRVDAIITVDRNCSDPFESYIGAE